MILILPAFHQTTAPRTTPLEAVLVARPRAWHIWSVSAANHQPVSPPTRATALLLILTPILPQVLGSLFNIWYNATVTGPLLQREPILEERFHLTVLLYNAAAYPLIALAWVWLVLCVWRSATHAATRNEIPPATSEFENARRLAINLPWWGAALAATGWLLCIPVFLGSLAATGVPLDPHLYWHFPVSFLVSALIAVTHSFFLVELATHKWIFPSLFAGARADLVPGSWPLTLKARGVLWMVSASVCPILSLLLLAFAPADELPDPRWLALFIGIVGIGFGLGTAGMMNRLVARPLTELVRAFRAVARGNLDIRVDAARADEFGLLAAEFNQMTGGLRENERLRDTFGLHVGQQAARRILARAEGRSGTLETVTILFLDIRGFTARSASTSPEEIVVLLNRLFSRLIPVIEEQHGGMVNKFLGDGLMAVFGLAADTDNNNGNHAVAALAAGRGLLAAVREFNHELAGEGAVPLEIGIGIHSGPAIVGSIGAPRRQEFTVMGPVVNLASRLESLTKETRHPLLISDDSRRMIQSPPADLIPLPTQPIRGLDHPVTVHGLSSPA